MVGLHPTRRQIIFLPKLWTHLCLETRMYGPKTPSKVCTGDRGASGESKKIKDLYSTEIWTRRFSSKSTRITTATSWLTLAQQLFFWLAECYYHRDRARTTAYRFGLRAMETISRLTCLHSHVLRRNRKKI